MNLFAALLLTSSLLVQDDGENQQAKPARPAKSLQDPSTDQVRAAIQGGLEYLLSSQNEDGSWGGVKNATFTSAFGNPATYHCWMVGTTALATQSMMELSATAEAVAAADAGLRYLMKNANLVRPAEWDVDNNWGLVYGLNTIAVALGMARYQGNEWEDELRAAGNQYLKGLWKYQSPRGGWGYYANPSANWRPDWATSFTTAAGVLALVEAKKVGLDVPDKMYRGAIRAVERSHLPNGAYNYDVSAVPRHFRMESINQVKGSLGRIQVGNYALLKADGKLKEGDLEWGVEQFFKHHKFLDVARNKPIPHEAYYANAAYFYLFGHYYASKVIEELPGEARAKWEKALQREILKCQQKDGSMWDFWIASCSKPYGTSFGIMALSRTVSAVD